MVSQITYWHAAALGDMPAWIVAYREMMHDRGGRDYFVGLVWLLIAVGEYSEPLDSVAHWKSPAGEPARPFREEIEATVAQLRGDGATMLRAARAVRRYPGWEQQYLAAPLEIAAVARIGTTTPIAPSVGFAARR